MESACSLPDVRGSQQQANGFLPKDEKLLPSIRESVPLADLPATISDLHLGMPKQLQQPPLRLLKIRSVLAWPSLPAYEDVAPSACINLPYSDVSNELWDQTAVVSWRRAASKPAEPQAAFSPMMAVQFQELLRSLAHLRDHGVTYVWIDWCCTAQYGRELSMEVEAMRSKAYYARARAMTIVPSFRPLPADGSVRRLLLTAAALLEKLSSMPHGSALSGLAAEAVSGVLARDMVAGAEYFSRAWTLAERLARHGRKEQLCNWLSLDVWLGMLVDALLEGVDGKPASQPYTRILGSGAGELLGTVLSGLRLPASKAGSGAGLAEVMAELLEKAVGVWQSSVNLAEAPSRLWLLGYLEDAHQGVYLAGDNRDLVWAVYSYFYWKQLAMGSTEGLEEALQGLVAVAGSQRETAAGLAAKLGVVHSTPGEEVDRELFRAVEEGDLEATQRQINAGANTRWSNGKLDGATPLHIAAAKGNMQIVSALLQAGADVHAVKKDGETVLRAAILDGHLEVARALLQSGANVEAANKDGATALHRAALAGHLEIVRDLLEAGAKIEATLKDRATPLYLAAEKGKTDVLNLLIEWGARTDAALTPDGHTPVLIACLNNRIEALRSLIKAGAAKDAALKDGATPLYLAGEKGNLECMEILLAANANTELALQSGATPLYIAAQNNFPDCVRALVKAGANVDAARKDLATPIYISSERGNVEVVEVLLGAGADIECAFQSGATPLYVASQNNRLGAVTTLLRAHANKHIKLKGGYTPIHSAAMAGHLEVVRALIDAGVDKDLPLEDGATPMYLAAEKGHAEVVKLLLQMGADPHKHDVSGVTALDVARRQKKEDVVRLLSAPDGKQGCLAALQSIVPGMHAVHPAPARAPTGVDAGVNTDMSLMDKDAPAAEKGSTAAVGIPVMVAPTQGDSSRDPASQPFLRRCCGMFSRKG